MCISPDCGLLWVNVVMLGFPCMKNSRPSHASSALLIPINPCIAGSFLVAGMRYISFWTNHTAVLLEEDWLTFSGISDQFFLACMCADGIVLTCPKLNKYSRIKKSWKKKLFSPTPAPAGLFQDTKTPSQHASLQSWYVPDVKTKDKKLQQRLRVSQLHYKSPTDDTFHASQCETKEVMHSHQWHANYNN